jgi:N-acetylglucosamine-6-sulfatase
MSFSFSHRLAFVGAALLAAAGLALAASHPVPGAPEGAHAARTVRPNVVLFQTDDQTTSQLTRRVMPNTKRLLVKRGTTFKSYIATTPQCCPSRASLITGQHAHNHGVTSNEVGYPGLEDKNNVLPVWLQQAGYTTIHVGKFLNGYQLFADPASEVAPGWDQWRTVVGNGYYNYDYFVNGRVLHHGSQAGDHVTHVLNRDAVRVVHRYAPDRRPFYLQLDQRAPHNAHQPDPFGSCEGRPIPQPRDENLFKDASLPKPPSFNEHNMNDKPAFIKAKPKLGARARTKLKKRWRCALASLAGVDRGVAKVYQAVKDAGELGKTVFIFISDNGLFHGQHRLPGGKVFPYEEALRLPLVIGLPKRFRDGGPRVRTAGRPVGNIDLAPTILDLANAQPCPPAGSCRTLDGRSLLPLLTRSGRWPARRGLLTEYRVPDLGAYSTCRYAGIRTRSTIYVEHSRVVDPSTGQCVDTAQREWYDLNHDPFELHNQCFGGRPANCPAGPKRLKLDARLTRLRDCAGIAGRDQPVGGRPFCE